MADDQDQTQDAGTSIEDFGNEVASLLDDASSKTNSQETAPAVDTEDRRDKQTESGQEPEAQDEQATDVEQTDEPKAEATEEPTDRQELKTLEDVAKALELEDPQGLYKLNMRFKAAGQDVEATLEDVVRSYQFQSHLTKRSQELAEAQKQAATAQQEYLERAQTKVQELDDTVIAVQSFMAANPPDESLRNTDPQEYIAQVERWNQAQQVMGEAYQRRQKVMEEATQAQAENRQKLLAEQRQKLVEYIPEWSDSAKAQAETQSLSNYLLQEGYGADEVKAVIDARAVKIARKAMLYDQLKAQTPKVMAKFKAATAQRQVQKPGAERTDSPTQHVDGLLGKAVKSAKLSDFGDAIAAELERAAKSH